MQTLRKTTNNNNKTINNNYSFISKNSNHNQLPIYLIPYFKQYLEVSSHGFNNITSKIMQYLQKQIRSERQNRQIFEYLKDRRVFPKIVNNKILAELVGNIYIEKVYVGEEVKADCWILVEGVVKIFRIEDNTERILNVRKLNNQQYQQQQYDLQQQQQQLRITNSSYTIPKNYKQIRKISNTGDFYITQQQLQEQQQQQISHDIKYIATTNSRVFSINRSYIEPILYTNYQADIKKLQQFFSSIALFSKMYRSSLNNLIASLQLEEYNFNRFIYHENQKINYIYIVKQGEFLVQKSIRNDAVQKQGKIKIVTEQDQKKQRSKNCGKNTVKNYRICPYKIIGKGEILGDCEYVYNNQLYINSMKCHKEGSKLYKIGIDQFFKKLFVPEVNTQKINELLYEKFFEKQRQIETSLKINISNSTILRYMPVPRNKKLKSTQYTEKQKTTNNLWASSSVLKSDEKYNSMQTLTENSTFFQKFNKTIINHKNRRSFRNRRNLSTTSEQSKDNTTSLSLKIKPDLNKKNSQSKTQLPITSPQINLLRKQRRFKRIPAVVQQVVQIVDLKKAYHKLRNLGKQRKDVFQFHADNVPIFIRNKYGHSLKKKVK